MLNKLYTLSAYLFCLVAILDPVNNVLGFKIPFFLFFTSCLIIKYKPNPKYFHTVICLVAIQFISILSGIIFGLQIDMSFFLQYLTFFLTLFTLLWCKNIDFINPVKLSCLILSLITIIGYTAMLFYPEIELVFYEFAISHDKLFLMSHRTFLGIEFNSFCYKSLPIVTIPTGIYFYKFINEDSYKIQNLFLFLISAFALFCGGNRALMLSIFCIISIVLYSKYKKTFFYKSIISLFIILFIYIVWLALTEKGEGSNDIKYKHLESYAVYFANNIFLDFWGGGAGSLFYSKGFQATVPLTEWTYIEIIRMYGIIGAFFIFRFLLRPFTKYKQKIKQIKYCSPVLIGYATFLIVCGSNPYLINSTGLICILFIYSYIENPQNRI